LDDFADKRQSPRIDVQWPITIFTGEEEIEAETLNISVDGISINCEEPLRLNEHYTISVMPEDALAFEVKGQVVWSDFYGIDEDDTAIGMGLCFVELGEDDCQMLKELVGQISE
jgi:PilZ domain